MALAAFAAVLVFVVLFWRLGEPTFWDPDEAHYAETTREMVATGDWMAPHYNEQPFFDKPALFHQLQGAAMLVFGPTEFAARLVPALAALVLAATTVWFGATMLSAETGVLAGLLLIACPGVFGLARYAILDTVFTAFVFGGAALTTVAALRGRPRLQYPGYVLIALGVLTKGPLAVVLCGLPFLLAISVSADLRRRLLGLRWGIGLAIVVALAAPWFIYMYLRFLQDFVNGYVLDENLRLFAGSRFANQPGFSFYFQILAVGLMPWTGLLVGRFVDDVRATVRGERLDGLETLLWAWTIAIVAFFTLSTFKLDHYVFPAAPALYLLCARTWSDVRADQFSPRHAVSRLGLLLVGPLLVVIGVACGYFLTVRLRLPQAAAIVPVALTLAGVVVTAAVNVRRTLSRLPWIVVSAMLVVYASVVLFVGPALEEHKVVDDLADWVVHHAQAGDRIASYKLNRWNPSFRFYVGRHTTFLEDPEEAAAFLGSGQPFYCVMQRAAYDEFVARGVELEILDEREGMWATSGRTLWRQRAPLARFVIVTRSQ
ncbi:MAG: hypothetical protein A3J29_00025 [Acidobacteria bacterium RIFCSPLOWO2_12_FULL_67_14b]|nr:MAG: hypothetical protein A3J29_00025 [Acidobacteria bacterium RIFCSPLOWO2_12_FULL_67_14b]